MSNYWRFSSIPCIEESTFNKVLERFYNLGISGLVRENIQNSLDGKLQENPNPVVVNIKTGIIKSHDIPGIDEIKGRISSLKGQNSYTKETIHHMQSKKDAKEVSYISFEDSNTKGLTGAKNGQSFDKNDTWGIYAYNKGVHTEDENEDFEKSRGGSHGIGKIASNAASELYMMYFANCDEEGNKHLGGTVQLIEHEYKGEYYRSTGYFTNIKSISDNNTKFYPHQNTFNEVFKKDTRGLKIIIPFLREQFNDEKEILRSVCNNFFIAIFENKLEVILNDKVINKHTIDKYVKDKNYYNQNIDQIKDVFTVLYLNTYKNKNPRDIVIEDIKKNKYSFDLYFDYDVNIPKGRVAIVRTIGMKIEDKKVKGNANKPFNAVLVPKGITEDAFLKSLENESHTELSHEHIKDQDLLKNAKRFINNISKELSKIIEDAIKEINPTDGAMNTTDILYEVETNFKKYLSKSMDKVKISKGIKEENIVKFKINDAKKKKDKKQNSRKKNTKQTGKVTKQVKVYDNTDNDENKIRYNVNPSVVERVVMSKNEYIKFDFTNSDDIKKARKCDVALKVVDGMGQECSEHFNLNANYLHAIDSNTGKKLYIKDDKIKDVKINNGIAQVKLDLDDNYNKALKFVYYVEV